MTQIASRTKSTAEGRGDSVFMEQLNLGPLVLSSQYG